MLSASRDLALLRSIGATSRGGRTRHKVHMPRPNTCVASLFVLYNVRILSLGDELVETSGQLALQYTFLREEQLVDHDVMRVDFKLGELLN